MEVYNKYNNTVNIYTTDIFKIKYYNLINNFSLENKEFTNNEVEKWALSLMEECDGIDKVIINNDILVIALLFRQMNTFNKVLIGKPLSKLDIFFNDIFCESDITLL